MSKNSNSKFFSFSLLLITFFITFSCSNASTEENNESAATTEQSENPLATIEGNQKCLVGFDWVYPSIADPTSAWKFSDDGTFSYSTTLFGGMSAWGNWKVKSPGEIEITYTKSSIEKIPDAQVIKLSSCDRLAVGNTVYIR